MVPETQASLLARIEADIKAVRVSVVESSKQQVGVKVLADKAHLSILVALFVLCAVGTLGIGLWVCVYSVGLKLNELARLLGESSQ